MSTTLDQKAIEAVAELAIKGQHVGMVTLTPEAELGVPPGFGCLTYLAHNPNVAVKDITGVIQESMPNPLQRRGTVTLTSLDSFCEFVNRMKQYNTVVFADQAKRSLLAVFDYHDPLNIETDEEAKVFTKPMPQWGRFRAKYEFPTSPQWDVWSVANKRAKSQAELAGIIEDNIDDIQPPSTIQDPKIKRLVETLGLRLADPLHLLKVARGLSLNVDQQVRAVVNLDTGETQVQYLEEHTPDTKRGGDTNVPTGFILTIPVFEGDAAYQLLVRLKYRVVERKVLWHFDVYNIDRAAKDAFETSCQRMAETVKLPLFIGQPA